MTCCSSTPLHASRQSRITKRTKTRVAAFSLVKKSLPRVSLLGRIRAARLSLSRATCRTSTEPSETLWIFSLRVSLVRTVVSPQASGANPPPKDPLHSFFLPFHPRSAHLVLVSVFSWAQAGTFAFSPLVVLRNYPLQLSLSLPLFAKFITGPSHHAPSLLHTCAQHASSQPSTDPLPSLFFHARPLVSSRPFLYKLVPQFPPSHTLPGAAPSDDTRPPLPVVAAWLPVSSTG